MASDANDLNIKLRYVGGRFEGARLPLDVLDDLPAFRDLLVAFAKQEWRAVNPGRERVPKGFDKSLSFDLAGITSGSAVPAIRWDRSAAQSYLPGFIGELEAIVNLSFDDVVTLVDDAANGSFPKALSSEHVRALNRFGSSLRDDERIEFLNTNGQDGNVVFLDTVRRKSLITKVRETYESRFEDTGVLAGSQAPSDAAFGHITVETSTHGAIQISIDRDRVLAEFDGNIGAPVQFDLQVELDNQDKLRGIVEVHDVTLFDERMSADLDRCRARLQNLASLADGWDDGHGHAIHGAAQSSAAAFLSRRPLLCSRYKLFPTLVGGILLEFESNGWDISLEFAPGGSVELFAIQVEGEGEIQPTHFATIDSDFIAMFDEVAGR